MPLKYRLTKAAYDKLDDDKKGLYKDDDGSFILDVDGVEDAGEMRRARDREKQKRADVEAERDELKSTINELTEENSTLKAGRTGKDTDIAKLEAAWKKKVEDAEADRDEKVGKATDTVKKMMVESAASRLAGEISTAPKVMQRHIMDRLTVDYDGDEPALVVLDASGKPSRMTVEDLGKEFVADKDYSAIIVGSKARGSVTPQNPAPNAGGNLGQSQEHVDLSKLSGKDLAAHIQATKEAAE